MANLRRARATWRTCSALRVGGHVDDGGRAAIAWRAAQRATGDLADHELGLGRTGPGDDAQAGDVHALGDQLAAGAILPPR
jgi:hypothetical protein